MQAFIFIYVYDILEHCDFSVLFVIATRRCEMGVFAPAIFNLTVVYMRLNNELNYIREGIVG